MNIILRVLLAVFFIPILNIAIAQSGYKFFKRIPLKGNGKWDYLKIDEPSNRLFVSHEDRVHVINMINYTEIGVIKNLHGARHIILVPAVEKGFISNGDNNTVTVFNYATLESIATINIHGQHPDPMCYDEFSKKLFVFCDNNLAVVVDPTTNKEVDSIKLGGAPEYALPDNKGLIYNNLEDKDAIAVIDVQKKKVINNYRLSNKSAPTGLAMDVKNDRLFVACRGINRMSVVDAHSGRIIISLPIGGMADGIWFDDKTHYIFCSNGDGTTTIIRQETKDEYKVIDNITTKIGAKTMALDMKSHNIYLSSSDYEKGFPVIIPGTFAVLVYKMN